VSLVTFFNRLTELEGEVADEEAAEVAGAVNDTTI